MPGRQDLPESLAGLARRNALLIRHESFRSDAGRLVTAIERPGFSTRRLGSLPTAARIDRRPRRPASWPTPNASPTRSPTGTRRQRAQQRREGAGSHRPRPRRPLITDAERIAHAITNEDQKASALSGVAKALAATDPDRAARLIADAERIANPSPTSTTGRQRR